jgi:carbon monoxide dehydrogenase subunit G
MIFEDTVTLDAPSQLVWDTLLDINRMATCMPGVEDVKQIDDRTFDGTIAASVGPISGKFIFRAHILESDPPRELTAEVKGTDSVTKSTIDAAMDMKLTSLSAVQTELAYHAKVDVHGRLAILGDMVLRATGALMCEEFFKRFKAELAKDQ